MDGSTRNPHCKALTKKGKPCQAAAMAGGLCFFHANPNKAVELGRLGGKANRWNGGTLEPLPNIDTAEGVLKLNSRIIREVYAGELNPRVAWGLTPLLSLQLRSVTSADHEARIIALEERFSKTGPESAGRDTRSTSATPENTMNSRNAEIDKCAAVDDEDTHDKS